MSWTDMLFSPYGRIRRRDFWLWMIAKTIGVPVLFFALLLLLKLIHLKSPDTEQLIGVIIMMVCWATFVLSNICLIVKRWHDRNKSGWLYLILFIPVLGWIWTLVECGCLDGTPARNRYGKSPKGLGEEARAF